MFPQHNGLSSGRFIELTPTQQHSTFLKIGPFISLNLIRLLNLISCQDTPLPLRSVKEENGDTVKETKKQKKKFIESPVVHLAFIHVHVRWIYFILLFHYFSSPVSDPVRSIPQIASVRCTKQNKKTSKNKP
jgi:hypothetical protein